MAKVIRIGVDEVGRGSLAGPVVAAAVVFLEKFDTSNLKDSKQLSASQRTSISTFLTGPTMQKKVLYGCGMTSVREINQMNIRNATFLAMHRAVMNLIETDGFPNGLIHICVDGGDKIPEIDFKQTTIIKGDEKVDEIKAASIIAKVFRDQEMIEIYHSEYPQYGWDQNKGYYTKTHVEKIKKYGVSPLHRNFEKFLKKIGVKYGSGSN